MSKSRIKPIAVLDEWTRVFSSLMGTVRNHPYLPDGEFIVTSMIVKIDEENNFCETLNTVYELGTKKEIRYE